ncbi:UNVERIFIED_CONTAM: N-acetylmuramoyl-L-alanine amidase [Acetivibrio alkalicellulosi]
MLKFKRVMLYISAFICLLSTTTNISNADGKRDVITTANVLNAQQDPVILTQIFDQMPISNRIGVLSSSNGWYDSVYSGMNRGFELVEETSIAVNQSVENLDQIGRVTASTLNVREGAGTNFKIIGSLNSNERVEIKGQDDSWYKIITSTGSTGWVHSSYVSIIPDMPQLATRGGGSSSNNIEFSSIEIRKQLVEYSKNFLGVRYVYGGSSPSGFDCSGFVWYVFNNFDIRLERVASSQATQGKWIAKEDLLPGDLVFFDTRGNASYINHSGIYIGGGNFIHASSGNNSRSVVISDITSGFYQRTYMTARRILD